MARLLLKDFQALNAGIVALYAHPELTLFPMHTLQVLEQVIPAGHLSYADFPPHTFRPDLVVLDPPELIFPESHEIFAAYVHQHPVARRVLTTGEQRALKISDFLSRRQFHRLALYNEFFRRLGTEYQLSMTFPTTASHVVALALSRERRDFTERDRLCLTLLLPHLYYAYGNAHSFTHLQQDAQRLCIELEALDRGVIVLEADGHVRAITDQAWQWLVDYFETTPRHAVGLPEEVQGWVQQQHVLSTPAGALSPPRRPLCKDRAGTRLVLRLVSTHGGRQYLVLAEHRTHYAASALERLGLSKRQAEVLFWVAHGKTDQDVAEILGMRLRTVQKHLERIYPKLGVDNRTAATNRAWELLGEPDT